MIFFALALVVLFGSPAIAVMVFIAIFGEWTPGVIAVGASAYLAICWIDDWMRRKRLGLLA